MSDWIAICAEEGEDPIEIETEEDGVLLLESVTAHFPGTTTLKYRNTDGSAFRGVKCLEGRMNPPTGGWDEAPLYICVNPNKPEKAVKRKAESEDGFKTKSSRNDETSDLDPEATIDLILLGLNPSTTEAAIREYFEKRGKVSMIQMKKSKDSNVGYAFIKFTDKDFERQMMKEKHTIYGKQAYLKIPDSQQGDRSERKVYVSYHSEDLTATDLREHFEKFGEVEDVFIPKPWRHFCFVTFTKRRVAMALLGKEQTLNGVSLLIKRTQIKERRDDRGWEGNMGGMGMMDPYEMRGMGMSYGMGSMGMGGMGMSRGSMGMPRSGASMGARGNTGMGMERGAGAGGQIGMGDLRHRIRPSGYGEMFGEQSYRGFGGGQAN